MLFPLADVGFPQSCCDEVAGVPIAGTIMLAATLADQANTLIRPGDSGNDQPSRSPLTDDDCFCCCSHILPSPALSVGVSGVKPPAARPSDSSLPSAPPRSTFHPPRLA